MVEGLAAQAARIVQRNGGAMLNWAILPLNVGGPAEVLVTIRWFADSHGVVRNHNEAVCVVSVAFDGADMQKKINASRLEFDRKTCSRWRLCWAKLGKGLRHAPRA